MPQAELPSRQIEDARQQVNTDWKVLSDVFPKAKGLVVPRLVFFEKSEGGLEYHFLPEVSAEESVVLERQWSKTLVVGQTYYDPEIHTIVANMSDALGLNGIYSRLKMTEEETHAATSLGNGKIVIVDEGFHCFNGWSQGFGLRLKKALKKSGIGTPTVVVDINELFPPLGQALLIGTPYKGVNSAWEVTISSLPVLPPIKDSPQRYLDVLNEITGFVSHLPFVAGELLVRQYNYDIERLVRENPRMFTETPEVLWKEVVEPVLINGKL